MSKILSYFYNSQNILVIEPSSIYFYTILPIDSFKNTDIIEEEEKEKNKKTIERNIVNMTSYITPSLTSKARGGAIYKFITNTEALSPLQKYQLEKEKDTYKELLKEKVNKSYFEKIILKYQQEELIQKEKVKKTNYLIVQTFFAKEDFKQVLKSKQVLYDLFEGLTYEKREEIKSVLEILYLRHEQSMKGVLYDKEIYQSWNSDNFLEILSSLNKTDIRMGLENNSFHDLFYNVERKKQREDVFQITVYETVNTEVPEVLIIDSNQIQIKNQYGEKRIKINYGEEILFKDKKGEEIKDINSSSINYLKVIKKDGDIEEELISFISPYKLESSSVKNYTYSFWLESLPPSLNENVETIVQNELKGAGINSFHTYLEVLKKSNKDLINNINMENILLGLLSSPQMPSLRNMLYNKDIAIKKYQSNKDMVEIIDDGGFFCNVRYGFEISSNFEIKGIEDKLRQSFTIHDLNFQLIPADIQVSILSSPIIKENFASIKEKAHTLEIKEVSQFLNFDYGDRYFSGLEDKTDIELAKLDNCHIYIETRDKIQSLNLFEGPDMFNGLIIAPSGSGKSFTAVNLISGFIASDPKNLCWILDRGGSYVNFTDVMDGNNIEIKRASKDNCINPYVYDNYFAKLIALEKFLYDYETQKTKEKSDFNEMLLEQIEEVISSIELKIGDEVKRDENGEIISFEFKTSAPQELLELFNNIMLEMLEVKKESQSWQVFVVKYVEQVILDLIISESNLTGEDDSVNYMKIDKFKTRLEQVLIKADPESTKQIYFFTSKLTEYIDPLKSGKLFNGKPNLDLKSTLINIDFGEIQNEDLSSLILSSLVLNFFAVMTSPQYAFSKKLLLIDEAHVVLNSKNISGLKSIAYLYRTARKHGASVFLLSQNISDFVKVPGEAPEEKMGLFSGLMANSGWIFLLGNHAKKDCMDRLDLSEKISTRISLNRSREFFLKSKESAFISLVVNDLDYAIATTNKEEKNLLNVIRKFSEENKLALVIYAILFGKDFLIKYKDINNLKKEFGMIEDFEVEGFLNNYLLKDLSEENKKRKLAIIEDLKEKRDKNKDNQFDNLRVLFSKISQEGKIKEVRELLKSFDN